MTSAKVLTAASKAAIISTDTGVQVGVIAVRMFNWLTGELLESTHSKPKSVAAKAEPSTLVAGGGLKETSGPSLLQDTLKACLPAGRKVRLLV